MSRKRKLGKSAINNIYRFASRKVGKTILTESTLEFHACFHFEYSSQIITFESQPLGFDYFLNGRIRSYTPDFAVVDCQGIRQFYEVKPEAMTHKESFKEEFAAKKIAALELRYALDVIVDRNINAFPLLNNLKILHRYALQDGKNHIINRLMEQVRLLGSPTIEQLNREVGQGKNLICEICCLISRGVLSTNLYEPINIHSNVWEA